MRVGVLISGRGSNMVALADAARQPHASYQIVGVLCNRPDAEGLKQADALGLATVCVDHTLFNDREGFDLAIADALSSWSVDILCLAGFMRILSPALIDLYPGRILNIHPSLLPLFPGLHTHRRVLEAGMRIHGCTVHIVSEELDAGPILGQAAMPVVAGDTPESLAGRVIRMEHRLYPATLDAVARGDVSLTQPADRRENPGLSDQFVLSV